MELKKCIHQGNRIGPDKIECSSNHFVGPDFVIRLISLCNKPCPFSNKENLSVYFLKGNEYGGMVDEGFISGRVGTNLKRLLRVFSLLVCAGCAELAAFLDERGPAWCRENIEWILDEMKKNSKEAGIPFSRFVAKRFVMLAIRQAERE